MKRYFIASILLFTAGLAGCINISGWRTVQGSGQVITESREVSHFDRVSVSGAGEITVEQGEEEALTIEADDNLLPYLRSEVSQGHLTLGPENVNLRSTQPIRYRLKVKDLTELHLSGSVRAEAARIKTKRFTVAISGSGRMNVGHLDAQTLSSHISGSGRTSAAGQVESQDIHISGSGDHHAPELQCARAQAHISGSGDASLWVKEVLTASISGSGRVQYRGSPSVNSHVSGSGRVQHVNGGE